MAFDPQGARADKDCLAAAAMVFAPATEVPRERALLRSAIHSLIHAYGSSRFRCSEAIDAIANHGKLPELRPQVTLPLFERLHQQGIVQKVEDGDDPLFQLDGAFLARTRQEKTRVEGLIANVINDLFSDLSLTSEQKTALTRDMLRVLAEIMARFGRQYAYQVAGRADSPIAVERHEFVRLCKNVLANNSLGRVSPEKMADAVAELFASREPRLAQFVFSLTQNYFYMRLLGLAGGLQQLREDRFEGAEFFLDTNIVIAFLLQESRHHRSVLELQDVAYRMKVSLHVSELTLEELNRVVEYHRSRLSRTYDVVPEELVPVTRNAFLRAYRSRKLREKDLTPQEFLATFVHARKILEDEWDVSVMDEPVERTIAADELAKTHRVLNEHSVRVRNVPKGDRSLDHDAHMYYLIVAERARYGDKAAWILTLDTSLPQAAVVLQGSDAVPFAMSLDGFLQIMSPYVRSDHQQSFAEMYVELVGRSLFPPEEVLELDDFLLFTDMEVTVHTLPAEDVKRIIRRVKKNLDGRSVSAADKKLVAYEVQKALADPTLKYRVSLEEEISLRDRLLEQAEEDRKRDQERQQLELERTKRELGAQLTDLRAAAARSEGLAGISDERLRAEARRARRLRQALRILVSGIILGPAAVLVWLLPPAWLRFVKTPLALQSGICLSAITTWIALSLRAKWIEVVGFVMAVLGLLFAAWSVFW